MVWGQAQAEKPAWQTGAKSSISLRKPAPLKLNGHAAPVILDDDLIDEDDLLTEEDRLPAPAAGMLVVPENSPADLQRPTQAVVG